MCACMIHVYYLNMESDSLNLYTLIRLCTPLQWSIHYDVERDFLERKNSKNDVDGARGLLPHLSRVLEIILR